MIMRLILSVVVANLKLTLLLSTFPYRAEYMNAEMSLESDEEMTRRDAVLIEVRNIFIKWVHYVSTEVLSPLCY